MLTALITLRTLVVAAALVAVWRRARRETGARATWTSYRWGFTSLTASSALENVVVLAGHPVGFAPWLPSVLVRAGSIASVAFLYQGMAGWHRTHEKSRPAGRVDRLVGISCILGAAAVANLVVPVPDGWDGVLPQIRLVHVCALAVLLSAVLLAALGMPRELRARAVLIGTGVTAVVATQITYLALGPRTDVILLAWAAWGMLAAGYAVLAVLPPANPTRWHPSAWGVPAASSAGLLLGLAAVVGAGLRPDSYWALAFGSAAIAGSAVRLVRLVRDLADHDRALRQAGTDDLTGLANRRAFTAALTNDETRERTDARAVLLLDLDRFKEVNDQHGHAVGDELLARIATELHRTLPTGAHLARLGGDEFAVILDRSGPVHALGIAHELLAAVTAVELLVAGSAGHRVGVSIGVAVSTGTDGLAGSELLRRADSAMYAAKNSGLGVALHDDATDRAWRERVVLSDELHAALRDPATDAFEVHYQPQVAADDTVVGVEALVRWRHPRLGLLAPGAFLDVLEERGLMPALTVVVARQAVADQRTWQNSGHRLRLSINTSSTYLSDPDLLRLLDELTVSGADPADVVVEVTETSLMHDPDRALATCHEITTRGFSLSIDDFGTGYSSLAYLANLPASELKIDRAFTSRALADERIAAIVAGTVELAHHLGLRVVAEGVEESATLDLVRRLGCDESQGYLHSRPVPAAEFLHWLDARTRVSV